MASCQYEKKARLRGIPRHRLIGDMALCGHLDLRTIRREPVKPTFFYLWAIFLHFGVDSPCQLAIMTESQQYNKGGSMAKKELIQLTVRIPEDLKEKAQIHAIKSKQSLQELVANAIRAYLVANK